MMQDTLNYQDQPLPVLGIGPDEDEKIDKITQDLKLLK